MAENKLTMFGKTYNTVGSADSNLILQTRGDLKIRWGNKFIDLIKNGKIAVDVEFLKKANSKDSINSDGIYLVKGEESDEIWISIGGEKYNLYGEISSDYVSFVKPLEVTQELKYQALQNIGIYYNSYQEALDAKVLHGIIYCEDTKKLYTIKDGLPTEYTIDIVWPDQLIIGNITIDGKTNTIYSKSEFHLGIGTTRYISCSEENLKLLKSVIFENSFESSDFTDNAGFAILEENGQYTLIIDNLKLRGTFILDNEKRVTYTLLYNDYKEGNLITNCDYIIIDFQNEWELTDDIYTLEQSQVTSDKYYDATTGAEIGYIHSGHDINVRPIKIRANSSTELAKVCHFVDHPEWDLEYDINFKGTLSKEVNGVTKYFTTKGRITKLTDENGNVGNFDFKHRTFKVLEDLNNDNLEYDEEYCYTFNQSNPDYYRITPRIHMLPYLSKYYHKYRDASLYNDKIKNNIIRIKEPLLREQLSITVVHNDETGEDEQIFNTEYSVTLYDDYVIFNGTPHDNNVGFEGHYIINNDFYGNTFKSMTNSTFGSNSSMLNCTFTGSILDRLAINGEVINCSFDYTYNVTINNVIKDCSFKAIMGPDYLSNDTFNFVGPLNNVILQSTIQKGGNTISTPNARENITDTSIIEPISEVELSSTVFPRLGGAGVKTCVVVEKTYNEVQYKVFSVGLSSEDNTPPGIIAMYSGLREGIPAGWVICDGTNGTPDLRGRFIRMVDTGELCGAKNNSDLVSQNLGGSLVTRQAYLNKTVKHTHIYKTYSELITADYSGLSFQYETNSLDISGLTVNGSILSYALFTTSGSNPQAAIGYFASSGTPVYSKVVNITHDNTKHSISGSLGNMPAIEVTGDIYVNIEMTPEQDTENDFPEYINVEPQAYALIFIMKL